MVVAGDRSWDLEKGVVITGRCRHTVSLECGIKYEITDQVRQVPYLCLSVEESAESNQSRLAQGELYLFRTSEGVNLEVSLDPALHGHARKREETGPALWAPFSLVGHAVGLSEPLVDEVFRTKELATYQRTEDADSWLLDLYDRLSVTVVGQRDALKLPLNQGQRVLVPNEVVLLNTQKLNITAWEGAILQEMRLASTVTDFNGGILREMRDYCARQAPLKAEVLARLRAATAQGGSVDVYAYEMCHSLSEPYRAAELSTDDSMIQAHFQADQEDGNWTDVVAHFAWEVPRIVTGAFMGECKSSCKGIAAPFLSQESLAQLERHSKADEDFGEVSVIRKNCREVSLPPIHSA